MKQNLLNLFLVKQDYLAIKARCANQQYINGLVLFRNYKHSLNRLIIHINDVTLRKICEEMRQMNMEQEFN
jgi:hypothetical protein